MLKQQSQMEEVSQAIDAINQNAEFSASDPQVKQLIATALLVKQYGRTEEETVIINRLAKRIQDELAARRRRKRLLTAIGGVAAAALLFAGTSWKMPAEIAREQPPASSESSQLAADTSEVAAPSAAGPASSQPPQTPAAATPKPGGKIVAKQPPQASTATPRAKREAAVPESKRESAAQAPPQAAAAVPEPKRETTAERPPQLAAATPESGGMILMVLPDRPADAVLTEENGAVRQVYDENTDQEIVITQRAKRSDSNQAVASSPAAAAQSRTTAAALNKATRQINGVEVVVEGRRPQAELEKVAASLVPAAREDRNTHTPDSSAADSKEDQQDKQE